MTQHHLVQRVLQRMLHDPRFAAQVKEDPAGTLAPLGIEEGWQAELGAIDPRALRTDPLRRRRVLSGLAGEFRAAITLLLAEWGSLARLDAFFGSAPFVAALAGRLYWHAAFAEFLRAACAELREPVRQIVDEVAWLEGAMARCRRVPMGLAVEGRIRLADGVELLRCGTDVVAALAVVERYRFELSLLPEVALCTDGPRPDVEALLAAPPSAVAGRWLVVSRRPGAQDVGLEEVDGDLAALIEEVGSAGAEGQTVDEIQGWLAGRGLGPRGAAALLATLVEDGTLL